MLFGGLQVKPTNHYPVVNPSQEPKGTLGQKQQKIIAHQHRQTRVTSFDELRCWISCDSLGHWQAWLRLAFTSLLILGAYALRVRRSLKTAGAGCFGIFCGSKAIKEVTFWCFFWMVMYHSVDLGWLRFWPTAWIQSHVSPRNMNKGI